MHVPEEVGSIERRDDPNWGPKPQRYGDVALNRGCGRSCKRQDGTVRSHQGPESAVGRSKIVTPSRDTMSLVYHEQSRPGLLPDPRERARLGPLWRYKVDGRSPAPCRGGVGQFTTERSKSLRRQLGMQRVGVESERSGRSHLVPHQGDQRADNHHGAGTQCGGQQVTEALPAPGRENTQCVSARKGRFYQLPLPWTEGREAKAPSQLREYSITIHTRGWGTVRGPRMGACLGDPRQMGLA